MSFASESFSKGYLRRKMPTIVSKVKVREIMIHLPCLTDHDRENIEAKRETNGNFDGMVLLLQCLKRRENWPEQLIEALEACEQPTIAAEIRAEYNALRGVNNSNPSSPSATVISAHVHPTPPASHVPIPETGGNSQAKASAVSEIPAHISTPLEIPEQRQATERPEAQIPKTVSPPEAVSEPLLSTQIEGAPLPSTPPPSPETPRTPASTPPSPQREVNAHLEPEENSESDIQDITGDTSVIPDQVSAVTEDSVSCAVTPPPPQPVEHEIDTLPCLESLQATETTEITPPQSPSLTNSDVTNGSSVFTLTPEKPPVQDTTPPAAVMDEEEEVSKPLAAQVVDSSPQFESASVAPPLPLPGAALMDASHFNDNSVLLSKPGQLISIDPQNDSSPTFAATNSLVEPYSGNSERLEISEAALESVTFPSVPTCSAVSSTNVNTIPGVPFQENSIAVNHNEPEENHYESPSQSLDMQEVLVNVIHVSQEASILNLDGQTSTLQAEIVNSEAAKEINLVSPSSISSLITHSSENYHPSEPTAATNLPELQTQPDSKEKKAPRTLTLNTKYFLTAAGVGAFALLMAWKFKK